LTAEELAEAAVIAAAANADPLLYSDCEGTLRVWRESALLNVIRDGDGEITGWREPFSYRPSDLVVDDELSSWDEGEDEEDDRLRQVVEQMVRARALMPALAAEVERLRAQAARAEELDKALGEVIDERDTLHDRLDAMAYAVAPIKVIGEHSSENDPWRNAADLITPAAEVERLRAALSDACDQVAALESDMGGWSARVRDLTVQLAGARNENAQWQATFGRDALPHALRRLEIAEARVAEYQAALDSTHTPNPDEAERLRAALEDRQDMLQRSAAARTRQQQQAEQQAEMRRLAEALHNRTEQLVERDTEIAALRVQLAAASAGPGVVGEHLTRQQEHIADLTSQLDAAQQMLAERDADTTARREVQP
jgi:chromosome segregation ATPase